MTSTTQSSPVSKTALWTGYVLSALPVLALIMSGVMKLMQTPSVVEGFDKFGYPHTVIFGLGIVELACTLIYLMPRTAVLGAILLTGYLGGATATLVRVSDNTFFAPILLGVMVWGGLYMRDQRVRALIPFRQN